MLLFTGDYAFVMGGILREQSESVCLCSKKSRAIYLTPSDSDLLCKSTCELLEIKFSQGLAAVIP